MKIAVLGTRGIPANYGGFETFAEELSARLARRGHEVTVYCRSNNISYPSAKYRGVGLFCLDDLQFLAGKRATQVEMLHTIDTLLRGMTQPGADGGRR